MATTINASTSGGLVQTADTSGTLQLQSAGTTQFTVDSTGAYGQLERGTAVATTSGTSIDFTGLPSWIKRITVMFNGVSTSGTSAKLIQIGDSGGIENTGYLGTTSWGSAALASGAWSAGCLISGGGSDTAAAVIHGTVVIANLTGNDWSFSGTGSFSNVASMIVMAGSKSLTATLDRVRFTTVNGTDTFDAGSINIMYEG